MIVINLDIGDTSQQKLNALSNDGEVDGEGLSGIDLVNCAD